MDPTLLLQKKYDLTPHAVEKITTNSTNELYCVNAAEGTFFLKKLTPATKLTEEHVRAEIDIVLHLHMKRVPVILPVKNIQGDMLTIVDGVFYMLYPFVELDSNATRDFSAKAAKILATFHNALEDFDSPHEFHTKPLHTELIDIASLTEYDFKRKRPALLEMAKTTTHSLGQTLNTDAEFLKDVVIKILFKLRTASFTKETVLHYDFNKDNLFFSKGKFVGVTDFEYSHKGYVETDVVKAARYFAEDRATAEIDIKKFRSFIQHYAKHNTLNIDWELYTVLLLYIIVRRAIHAGYTTLEGKKDLSGLYAYDVRMLRYIVANHKKFASKTSA